MDCSPAERKLLEHLRRHPQLCSQLQSLLELVDSDPRSVASIDEIEAPLIQLLRQLGNGALQSYAAQAEEALAQQLRREHPQARIKKKDPDVV